jgi:hypothetical protein
MSDVRYSTMHPFDWGWYKPDGRLLLAASATLYVVVLALARVMVLRIGREAGPCAMVSRSLRITFIAMGVFAGQSLFIQFTSCHHQESVHMTTLVALLLGLVVTLLLRLFSRRAKRSGPGCQPRPVIADR